MEEAKTTYKGFLQPRDAWDALSMKEKAEMIGVAVRNGITNLNDIRDRYNEFAEGGSKEEAVNTDEQYLTTMEKVAEDNYQKWGFSNPDEALLHALNDNTYNYRRYYNKYPQSKANADTHWTDEFKTVYHPTFSNESIYSGQKSQYNPLGLPGGFWSGDTFVPMAWQIDANEYKKGGSIHISPSKKGTFTAAAKKHGKSVQAFASQVLAHPENYSPAMRRKANFARNARRWKHGLGGNLFDGTSQPTQKMQIGLDVQGWPDYTIEQIVAYGDENERRRKAIQDAYLNFMTESNDATTVANGRPQNQHLVDKAIKGAKAHRAWEEKNPIMNTVGLSLGAVPFAVAVAPAIIPTGDAIASTTLGKGVASLLTNPYFDAAMTSLGSAHAAQSIANGEEDWMTALELAPMVRLAKPMYNAAIPVLDAVTENTGKAFDFMNSPITGKWTTFGNKQYRFKPGYIGANSTPIETRALQAEAYGIENLPGYQLRSLMRGNPLEKQLSKTGTISINSIKAQANKGSAVEKEVISKVLSSEQFAGQKAIDYNAFRKAVQDELVTYDRIPSVSYENYGANRIGFDLKAIYRNNETESRRLYNELQAREHDFILQHGRRPMMTRANRNDPSFKEAQRAWDAQFGEEWQEIKNAWNNFYNTHPRFSTVPGQSDWTELVGYEGDRANFSTFTFESPRMPFGSNKHYNKTTLGHSRTFTTNEEPEILHVMESQSDWGQQPIFENGFVSKVSTYDDPFNILHNETKVLPDNAPGSAQIKYLHDNYISRQIQENLKWAAEHGQSKMRYPTPETATKIEGYSKELTEKPQIQTILKKYADFPKIYGKLYRGSKIRTITDAKGNTWYEVDVPKDYLNQEWQYRNGGYLKHELKI